MQVAHGPVTFLNRTYDEALGLLVEARNYLAYQEPRDRAGLAPEAQAALSLETTRMTATLTQVMAWLLVQKAVFAGELSDADAALPANRLGGHAVCLSEHPDADDLPTGLRGLLDRSRRLYVRVARLDDLVGRDAAAAATSS